MTPGIRFPIREGYLRKRFTKMGAEPPLVRYFSYRIWQVMTLRPWHDFVRTFRFSSSYRKGSEVIGDFQTTSGEFSTRPLSLLPFFLLTPPLAPPFSLLAFPLSPSRRLSRFTEVSVDLMQNTNGLFDQSRGGLVGGTAGTSI